MCSQASRGDELADMAIDTDEPMSAVVAKQSKAKPSQEKDAKTKGGIRNKNMLMQMMVNGSQVTVGCN